MALAIGRKGKLYVAKHTAYGDTPALAAANAVRHVNVGFSYDPYARVTSPEKKQSPGAVNRFDRRTSASLSALEVLLRPSGTLNTLPECDLFLEALFGSRSNITLSTTVTATTGTIGGATLAAVTGLAVGQGVLITVGTKRYVRILTSLAGNVVTWAPNLPSAPADGAAVKGVTTYRLSTDLAVSLLLGHYLTGFGRNLFGVGLDQGTLAFDGTEEARLTATGPAQKQLSTGDAGLIAEPGGFTTVGGNPPTGMAGELRIGNNAYLHKSLEIAITNGLQTRNVEAGNDGLATEIYRAGRREVAVSLEAFVETPGTLYDLAKAGTNASVFRQNGWTEGNILAAYLPKVEFKPASTDDPDEAASWAFEGTALETADAANDEITLVIA